VDFVLDLPWSLLCDGRTGKIIFRESVKHWVPKKIFTKPKMGFGPPDASWYRGTLKEWIKSELSEEKIKCRGIFKPHFVRKTLEDHFQGTRNNVALIWSLLSFESWCRVFGMFGGDLDHY
jgi:asparagine synthase (glutamine-hydrolysing)